MFRAPRGPGLSPAAETGVRPKQSCGACGLRDRINGVPDNHQTERLPAAATADLDLPRTRRDVRSPPCRRSSALQGRGTALAYLRQRREEAFQKLHLYLSSHISTRQLRMETTPPSRSSATRYGRSLVGISSPIVSTVLRASTLLPVGRWRRVHPPAGQNVAQVACHGRSF